MRSIAHALLLLWGWRRLLVALAAGAVSSLALAPFHAAPVLFLTLPVLVFLIDGAVSPGRAGIRRLRPAAAVGFWFGFGYNLAGLWWIGAAFLVEAETFAWLMPFAVLAMPAAIATTTAIGVALARLVWSEGPMRLVALGLGLAAADLLRGLAFGGFPWNLIGHAVAFTDVTGQILSVVGVAGATLLAVPLFALPALLADDAPARRGGRRIAFGLGAVAIAASTGFGFWSLARPADPGTLRLRIVQPAVDQSRKWSPEERLGILEDLITLSDTKTDPETLGALSFGLILWPETSLPFFLTEEPRALAAIGNLLSPGTMLLAGAPRLEQSGEERRFYNSAYAVDDSGRIVDAYDKVHLVPFGEYLPGEAVLGRFGLRQLVPVGGFSPGPRRPPLSLPDLPKLAVMICYEIIFSGEGLDPANRPEAIVNITNDAWFGNTPGPYQHLEMARIRAIEEGLPVLRAANSGLSAIIDPRGRVVARLGLSEKGILDGVLPRPDETTVFSRYGSDILFILYGLCLLAVAFHRIVLFRKH